MAGQNICNGACGVKIVDCDLPVDPEVSLPSFITEIGNLAPNRFMYDFHTAFASEVPIRELCSNLFVLDLTHSLTAYISCTL